jgi:hypothetical protein
MHYIWSIYFLAISHHWNTFSKYWTLTNFEGKKSKCILWKNQYVLKWFNTFLHNTSSKEIEIIYKGLSTVRINIGPVRTPKLKFHYLQIFFIRIISVQKWHLFWKGFWKMHVRIMNIESKTGAIFRIFLNFTEFHMFRH